MWQRLPLEGGRRRKDTVVYWSPGKEPAGSEPGTGWIPGRPKSTWRGPEGPRLGTWGWWHPSREALLQGSAPHLERAGPALSGLSGRSGLLLSSGSPAGSGPPRLRRPPQRPSAERGGDEGHRAMGPGGEVRSWGLGQLLPPPPILLRHLGKKSESEVAQSVRLFATPWTAARQAPPSMGFSSQEYWSGLPLPSPGDLPDLGIQPRSPALRADALPSEPPKSSKSGLGAGDIFCPEMDSISAVGWRKGLPDSRRNLYGLGPGVGASGLTRSPGFSPGVESSPWLAAPSCSASRTSSCSWQSQYCSRALSSFSRVSSYNVQLVEGPDTFSPPSLGLASDPSKPLKPWPSPLLWASMTKLGEAVASVGDGKIITMNLLQAPRPSLPISNT